MSILVWVIAMWMLGMVPARMVMMGVIHLSTILDMVDLEETRIPSNVKFLLLRLKENYRVEPQLHRTFEWVGAIIWPAWAFVIMFKGGLSK